MVTATNSSASVESSFDPSAAVETDAKYETEIEAYLLVSVGDLIYEPLSLAGESTFSIRQDKTNTIHVAPTSVWMERSTYDNQDCVGKGTVSLGNKNSCVLSNMIICLPNEVVLESFASEKLANEFGMMP